jgi:hypothetical protein
MWSCMLDAITCMLAHCCMRTIRGHFSNNNRTIRLHTVCRPPGDASATHKNERNDIESANKYQYDQQSLFHLIVITHSSLYLIMFLFIGSVSGSCLSSLPFLLSLHSTTDYRLCQQFTASDQITSY